MEEATLYSLPRNLVLAASAGTGKTHALTGVVIHALLGVRLPGDDAVPPSRLVASTFSRKAAGEIRGRIEAELERLSDPSRAKTSPYARTLARAREAHGLVPLPPKELARRAVAARSGLRDAFIGTLHGLAASLLGRHAFEAGLGAGITIADASLQSELERSALASSIEAAIGADRLGMAKLVDAAGGLAGFADVLRDLAHSFQEEGIPASDLVIDDDAPRRVEAVFEEARALASDLAGNAKVGHEATRFAHACTTIAKHPDAIEEFVTAAEEFFGLRLGGKLTQDPAVARWSAFREGLTGTSHKDRGRLFATMYCARNEFRTAAHALRRVLSDYELALVARMREEGVLGFSEALRAARDLLRDRPDVAASVSAEIDILLVDECQDVSRVQRDLVALLFAEGDAREVGVVPPLSRLRPRGLFVVGDRKQSIYGFRGADMALFAELAIGLAGAPARIALRAEPFAEEPRVPLADFAALTTNRRGSPALLAAANALSRRVFSPSFPEEPALYEVSYSAETEDLAPPEVSENTEPSLLGGAPVEWRRVHGATGRSSHADDALATADAIRELLEPLGPAKGRGRARAPREIAVLGFSNDVLDQTAFALARMGIPYVLRGLGLHATREAADVSAILRWVLDPKDRLVMAEVLRGPVASASDEALIGLTDERGMLPPDGWEAGPRSSLVPAGEWPKLRALALTVRRLHGMAHRLTAFELTQEAIRSFGLESVLARLPMPDQRLANTRRVIDLARNLSDPVAFASFLQRARKGALREREGESATDDDEGVRLLTIHASKGLDFPIVIIPQVGGGPNLAIQDLALISRDPGERARLAVKVSSSGVLLRSPSFDAAMKTARRRQRAERQRLTYVAFTRAREKMIFVGYCTPPKDDESATYANTLSSVLSAIERDPACASWFSTRDVSVRVQPPPAEQTALAFASAATGQVPRVSAGAAGYGVRELPIAPTALEDFHLCARRFELVHLFGLPEPMGGVLSPTLPKDGALDASREGTLLHGILEHVTRSAFGGADSAPDALVALERLAALDAETRGRIAGRAARFLQSRYAAVLRQSARLERELPFVIEVDARDGEAESEGEPGVTVVLRGTIDLLAMSPDGAVDVIDYKRSRGPDAGAYAFQLEVYALAARALFPEASRIRVGIVFLGEGEPEPRWLPTVDEAKARARIRSLGQSLVLRKANNHFPRAPNETCRAIACGFVARCYPKGT